MSGQVLEICMVAESHNVTRKGRGTRRWALENLLSGLQIGISCFVGPLQTVPSASTASNKEVASKGTSLHNGVFSHCKPDSFPSLCTDSMTGAAPPYKDDTGAGRCWPQMTNLSLMGEIQGDIQELDFTQPINESATEVTSGSDKTRNNVSFMPFLCKQARIQSDALYTQGDLEIIF